MTTRAKKIIFNDSRLFAAYMAGQEKAHAAGWMDDALTAYAAGDVERATRRVKNARFHHSEMLRHLRAIK